MIPEGIEILKHGQGTGVVELSKDDDFGGRKGSQRKVEFVLVSESAFQWHVHPKMREVFQAKEGTLSVMLILGVSEGEPLLETRKLRPGDFLTVGANTPHFVFNQSEKQISAFATQIITEPGGRTINFDF